MIEEKPLTKYNHKLDNTTLDYPTCQCGECPNNFFNLLSIGSRQSGKTYTLVKLLKHYESNKLLDKDGNTHPMRVIVISPTIDNNPVFKSLKTLNKDDIHTDYTDELLATILEDIKTKKKETDDYKTYVNAYELLLKTPEKKLHDLYDKNPEVFKILEAKDYAHPDEIDKPEYIEYPVNYIVLDDLLGTGGFNAKKNSTLLNAFIKNRHLGVNFCILIQSAKGVPKTIRLNSSVFHLCKFSNKKMILDDIYVEVSNILKPEEFDELYSHAVAERYGGLIIDCTSKEKKFYKNLDSELFISGERSPHARFD